LNQSLPFIFLNDDIATEIQLHEITHTKKYLTHSTEVLSLSDRRPIFFHMIDNLNPCHHSIFKLIYVKKYKNISMGRKVKICIEMEDDTPAVDT